MAIYAISWQWFLYTILKCCVVWKKWKHFLGDLFFPCFHKSSEQIACEIGYFNPIFIVQREHATWNMYRDKIDFALVFENLQTSMPKYK